MRRRPVIRKARALLALGPVVLVSWVGAHAAFTDSVDVTSSFSTGTVAIQANDTSATYAFAALAMANVSPGAVKYGSLKIANVGTSNFNYVMSTATTGSSVLAAALTIGIKVVPSATCDATAYTASSTTVYTETAGIGSAAIASRALTSGANEYLCFKTTLPSGASNALQGLSTNATFTFTATGT